MTETIFALITGNMRAAVAVIRVSGPSALLTYKKLTQRPYPQPRVATLATFRDPETKSLLDKGMAVYFAAPASFTGEDTIEYSLHGGRAVVEGFLSALSKIKNCRMAAPGEFTRRAFENEKLDLTAAEAVADLIDAETEAQRLQALDQLSGGLARLYQDWADRLKKILAHQEAEIEFPDEDMPAGIDQSLKKPIEKLIEEMTAHLNDANRGERLREGFRIAIIGAPNAGKSSLLNALAKRDVAIVSEEAGTTRDVIEVHLNLGGYPVIVSDTAGLRLTDNKIEAEGIRRAEKTAAEADLTIALFDSTSALDVETQKKINDQTMIVANKCDLLQKEKIKNAYMISAKTGSGMDDLVVVLTKKIKTFFQTKTSGPSLTRARHRLALEETEKSLRASLSAPLPELAAEDLRQALLLLGSITGRVHVEDLLDVIFKDFCIGK